MGFMDYGIMAQKIMDYGIMGQNFMDYGIMKIYGIWNNLFFQSKIFQALFSFVLFIIFYLTYFVADTLRYPDGCLRAFL